MPTVVLDAGHGGYDYGAVNGDRKEKDDNLRLALAVGPILKNCGINVIYTRNTDVFVPLLERSRISNNAGANLFVSFHRNASTSPTANGTENWVYSSPSAQSVAAANYVLDRLATIGVQSNRGIKYGNFSVLRETRAPSMLLELGFISNAEDNRLFDANFNAYANAIASAIGRALGLTCGTWPPTIVTPPTPPLPPTPPTEIDATIRSIQQTLNTRYGAGLTADGIWGPVSNRALIRAYQQQLNTDFNAGLVTDGIWGPRTRAATRNLRQGDRGNLVWIMQAALYVNGFPPVSIDGIFGPNTDNAVRSFQRANNLAADGIAGPNTFERLLTNQG